MLEEASKRVETLLERFNAFPATTGARADAQELVRVISNLYGEGLRRIAKTIREQCGQRADEVLEQCCSDPLVASLFVTHGLHPVTLEDRVARAVESQRESLRKHGASAEILSVSEDLVELRVDGAADLVPSLERAVYTHAPEVLEVRVVGATISLLEVR